MKRFLRIFELSKNEQRVVLIVMLVLIMFAFVGYQRRVHSAHVRTLAVPEAKTSPTPAQIKDEQ
jgi:hypothetical protein